MQSQQFLSAGPSFSFLSCASAWVLSGPQSLQRCACSGMAHNPFREVSALPQSTSSSSDIVISSVLPYSSLFPCSGFPSPSVLSALNSFLQRCHQLAQLWPATRPVQRQPEAVSDTGQPLASFHRGRVCCPPATLPLQDGDLSP